MKDHQQSLSERMALAARELEGSVDAQHVMDASVRLAVANVAGAEAAGISIVRAHREIDTPAATDQMAVDGDRLQYETREGPCLDAIWEEQTTYSPSLGYDARWPTWGPRVAKETGAQSVLSFQLFTSGDTLGAMNLYSRVRDGFDEQDRHDGLAIAAHVAIAVSAARRVDNLTTAMDTRSVVGQAMGILMERFDMDAAHAFAVLTRLSITEETKLRDIAVRLVETRLLPAGSGPPSETEAPAAPV